MRRFSRGSRRFVTSVSARISSYQLVPARTSWSILFTHTINAFGHSGGTYQYADTYQEIPDTHFKQSYCTLVQGSFAVTLCDSHIFESKILTGPSRGPGPLVGVLGLVWSFFVPVYQSTSSLYWQTVLYQNKYGSAGRHRIL